jgi:hypothetical protein
MDSALAGIDGRDCAEAVERLLRPFHDLALTGSGV